MTEGNEAKLVRTTSLGWMVQRIAGRLDRAMEARLADIGLNLAQFAVMMTVLEVDGLTQTEIGQRFGMPAYAISRALDHLEAAGLVLRQPHPTSRRTHVIIATAQGREIGPVLFAIVREVNGALVATLTPTEREVFRDVLGKLI